MTTREQREQMDSIEVQPNNAVRVRIQIDDRPQGSRAPDVRNYTLYATAAPKRYDYNVIEVHECDGVRYVLIDDRDAEHQLGRYGSGLHYTVLSMVPVADSLSTLLWSRLFRTHWSRLDEARNG